MLTKEQEKIRVKQTINLTIAVAETIRETCAEPGKDGCPIGPMYAAMQTVGVDYESFDHVLHTFVHAGIIRRTSTHCYWLMPQPAAA